VKRRPRDSEELEELEAVEEDESVEELESVEDAEPVPQDSEAVPLYSELPDFASPEASLGPPGVPADESIRRGFEAEMRILQAELERIRQAKSDAARHETPTSGRKHTKEKPMEELRDPGSSPQTYGTKEYIKRRRKLSGLFFETALPNEYLVEVGRKDVRPRLGGRRFRLFRKFLRIPASVQTLVFTTDNANVDYQGIGVDGYASWRVDPEHPEVAVRTLDFFDEDDPMARTNAELRTICVEAVRHVISNMSIDDALKKKDEIAENLSRQLKGIERKWGILFDQVGIEKVRIMSDRLFEQLQAQFRDGLRLEVERKRIATDRQIAAEQNAMREGTGLETILTNQKLELSEVEQKARVQEAQAAEAHRLALQKIEIDRATFREEQSFRTEKEKEGHALALLERTLKTELAAAELRLLKEESSVEDLRAKIGERQLELQRLQREVSQVFSDQALASEFIQRLPSLFAALQIDNYTVLDSGSGQVTPVTRVLTEVAAALKGLDLKGLLGGGKDAAPGA